MFRSSLKTLTNLSVAVLAILTLIGCGTDGGGVGGGPGAVGPGGQFGPGGCGNLYAPIGFSSLPGSGIYVDSASIVAGQLMQPWQGGMFWGQLNVGSGGVGGQFNSFGVNGQMSLNLQYGFGGGGQFPGGNPGFPGGVNQSSIQGSITLNQTAINSIQSQFGFFPGQFPGGQFPGQFPGQNFANICVNQLGLDLGYSVSNASLWGVVYLYVNGQGIALSF